MRLVFEHERECSSQWAAICSIAAKLGMTPETLRTWVRRAETDEDLRPGLYDAKSGRPLCVPDTKYKRPTTPASGDVEQIVAYAVSKNCTEAVLIYPTELERPLDTYVGPHIHVRSLAFALSGDLDEAGTRFRHEIIDRFADGVDDAVRGSTRLDS